MTKKFEEYPKWIKSKLDNREKIVYSKEEEDLELKNKSEPKKEEQNEPSKKDSETVNKKVSNDNRGAGAR